MKHNGHNSGPLIPIMVGTSYDYRTILYLKKDVRICLHLLVIKSKQKKEKRVISKMCINILLISRSAHHYTMSS